MPTYGEIMSTVMVILTQATYRRCLALFSLIHVALHVAFRHHPSYEFNDMEAWAPILISAASGALYLAIVP